MFSPPSMRWSQRRLAALSSASSVDIAGPEWLSLG
jgi:hypothetical protein